MSMVVDDNPRASKRARKSCERCRTRKQKCHGFPVCANCTRANEICVQPPSAVEEYQNGPNQVLLARISFLEARLAEYGNLSEKSDPGQQYHENHISQSSPGAEGKKNIADIVGFLSLGGEAAYVGASSGFSLATSLGNLVQATVWNKAIASTMSQTQNKQVSIAEIKSQSAGPPDKVFGDRIVEAYFTRVHLRYPFLDRAELMKRHADRFVQENATTYDQYGTFKLYMLYAIGSTMLKLTERYESTPPEHYFMTALQYISAARESHSVHNIEAMALLVLYNLRSPSNSGIWYMIGLAMRTCVDLGLHRKAYYSNVSPYEGQLRRRLFWTVYFLERVIAVSLGRPYSIADRDIDASLPLEIDDTVKDDGLIARTLAVEPSPSFQASRPSSNITLAVQCFKLKRIESYIQAAIYRVDKPIASLVPQVNPMLAMLEDWNKALSPSTPYETDYLGMHYYKAIRLLLQPFLMILPPTDERIALCLQAAGQICQIFKRLHQRDSYGHSFIALHSVFIAGVTICYCLFLTPTIWTFAVSNDLRACSSALFVMAERTPVVKKYRDALETVISATMEFLADPQKVQRSPTRLDPTLASPQQQHYQNFVDRNTDPLNEHFSDSSGLCEPPDQVLDQNTPDCHDYNPDIKTSAARGEGRQGEMGQMDAGWMLSLCEGEGFSLNMLKDIMRFEPSLGVL
ncbi:putative Zn(II)2Cys6 transcription factor [Calycina marina]|uniref:Zn(II)2Cys6 transcription factor n=1 Tax=Calycina marina TaxID=1763456 RepID=A0A9P7YX23_9HELO|nr:putative Zn(II)2Cys6 transcription factor [Calycina marina]